MNVEGLGEAKMAKAKSTAEVTTGIGTKSSGDAVEDLGRTPYSILKLILKLLFGVQIHVAYRVIDLAFKLVKVIQSKTFFNLRHRKEATEAEPVVDQQTVVKGVRKLRKAAFLNIEELFGLNIAPEMKRVSELMNEAHKAHEEGNIEKRREAYAKLRELDKPFQDGTWTQKFPFTLKYGNVYVDENNKIVDYGDSETDLLEVDSDEEDSFEDEIENDSLHEPKSGDNRLTEENALLKSRLAKTNTKLEEVLRMSSHLVEKLSKLNIQVEWMTSLSDRMTEMKDELKGWKKMLCEIEEERNVMKEKLSNLECLIKEEEQYLNDFSGESGYECDTLKRVKT